VSGSHGSRACLPALLLLAACSAPPPRPHDAPAPEHLHYLTGPGPYTVDCDAPEGLRHTYHVGLPLRRTLVTGTLQLIEPRTEHGRAAIVQVRVAAADGANTRAAGLLAGIMMNAPHTILFYTADGDYDERFAALSMTPLPIRFSLNLSGNQLTVTAAGVSKSIAIGDVERTHLTFECESAHVVFANVVPTSAP
jgi:hypothetical protein